MNETKYKATLSGEQSGRMQVIFRASGAEE